MFYRPKFIIEAWYVIEVLASRVPGQLTLSLADMPSGEVVRHAEASSQMLQRFGQPYPGDVLIEQSSMCGTVRARLCRGQLFRDEYEPILDGETEVDGKISRDQVNRSEAAPYSPSFAPRFDSGHSRR